MRSKEYGLPTSDTVGTGMSGNGDILAFGYNLDQEVDSMGRPDPPKQRPVGPTITGVIDCRDQHDALDGFVIEEGAVPQALAPFYQLMLETLPGRIPPKHHSATELVRQKLVSGKSRLLGPYAADGSTERTQVCMYDPQPLQIQQWIADLQIDLIMSHDSNQVSDIDMSQPEIHDRCHRTCMLEQCALVERAHS